MAGSLPDFRYPYDIQTTLDNLRSTFDDGTVARLMDRDRALEDYITQAAHAPFPFAVVAGDGSGDFTSIKAAIEAVAPTPSGAGATLIFVKSQSGGYTDSGSITPQTGSNVVIMATGATPLGPIPSGTAPARLKWVMGGFTAPSTGTTTVVFNGLDIQATSVNWAAASAGTFISIFDNCNLQTTNVSPGPLSGGGGTQTHQYYFSDSICSWQFLGGYSDIPILRGFSSRITLNVSSGGAKTDTIGFTLGTSDNSDPRIIVENCWIEIGANQTITTGGTVVYPVVIFEGNTWHGPQTINLQNMALVRFMNNSGQLTAITFTSDTGGVNDPPLGRIIATGNFFSACDITVAGTAAFSGDPRYDVLISGTYSRLFLSRVSTGNGCVRADVTLLPASNGQTMITVSCHNNFVIAALDITGFTTIKAVDCSGNNNKIFYTGSAPGVADTDSGTGNFINALPPGGAAGGDLSGTYPNPTVTHITSLSNFTTKGDLLAGSGGTGVLRQGVGSNMQALTADSTQSTGLKWVNLAGSPNLLTTNQESLELQVTTGWVADTGCTIATTAAQASKGQYSLLITAT